VAAGAATLFVELALIRYVPGQIRVLGYLTNFVLLAAFLGFGVGMLCAARWPRALWVSWSAPLALLAIVALAEAGARLHVLPSPGDFLFLEYRERGVRMPLLPFLGLAFVALSLAFVPLGHLVGRTLEGDRPLERYALNVAGSLLGIGAFVVLSVLGVRPLFWMLLGAAATLFGLCGATRRWWAAGVGAVLGTVLLAAAATRGATWSPYQKITTGPLHLHPDKGLVQEWSLPSLGPAERARTEVLPPERGFTLRVNDDSYQTPLDLRPAWLAAHPELEPLRRQYDLPFRLRPKTGEVLVLGAGSGNDVAAALRAGATRVDAVEIDPEILALGARHPERPYADPRVHVQVNDARTFLSRATRRWDTIVFGLVDSHVLASQKSNVRLDSFVFTRESFAAARARLAPGGVVIVSHAVGTPWFYERMRATLGAAFGKPPLVLTWHFENPLGIVYAAGETVRPGEPTKPGAGLLEDDWPFPYLEARRVPRDYLLAALIVALVALVAVRIVSGARFHRVDPFFFGLGAGFLLLETRALGVLSLLLGATWTVSSAVFAGVLVMALAATALAARLGRHVARVPWLAWALLAVLLLLAFAVPTGALAALPGSLGILAGVGVACLPLLASGTLFALGLGRAGSADRALASNLLGAILGGLVEYAAMVVGFRALVLLAAVFYALALGAQIRAAGYGKRT
jgi:SAM-dependent methyltransferase